MRTACCAVSLTAALVYLMLPAAPAPRPSSRPLQVYPGVYKLHWATMTYRMHLYGDGSYCCCDVRDGTPRFEGRWKWDLDARLFSVKETPDRGKTGLWWQVHLDGQLAGWATVSKTERGVMVKLAGWHP